MSFGRALMPLAILSWLALAFTALLAAADIVGLRPLLAVTVIVLLAQIVLMNRMTVAASRMRQAMDALADAADLSAADGETTPPRDPQAPSLNPEVDAHVDEMRRLFNRATRRWQDRVETMERRLTRSHDVLARLPDPILLLDERRRVVEANIAAGELLGHSLIGRDLAVALRNPAVLGAADAALRDGRSRVIDFDLSTAVERQLLARIIPLPGPSGNTGGGALLVLHDQTTARRTEQMRGDFIANASHELRTPLSTLLGFIETLRGPAADDHEAQKRFLDIMHQQATRMIRLVEDLLSLSRIELNEHMAPKDRVDIEPILSDLVDALQLKAGERGIVIETDIVANCPPVIGEADELTQVFQNLLDNAIKYGRPNSPVRITVTASAKLHMGCAVAVRDRGEGIPRTHLPRLTERFYRVDSARSRQMGGTGLGLAIVKHIVSRHRGQLEIESQVGVGSVFTVHLPTASAVPVHHIPVPATIPLL